MKGKRYYYANEILIGSTIVLENEEFHHLANVMRARESDQIVLFNGDGNFYAGKIKKINKKNAEIFIVDHEKSQNEPTVSVTLFQALAKGDKLSLIMQKITELGASELCLFESDFCDVKANTSKQERMDSISVSASKQCGRATIVKTSGIYSIKQIAEIIKNYDAFFVAYEAEDGKTLANELIKNQEFKNIAIMVGAEGGFSKNEIDILKQNGATIVSLGKRILRTETAGIICVGLATQILEK